MPSRRAAATTSGSCGSSLRADGRHPHLEAGVAERALLGLAGLVVEVHLLVRAARDAHAPATALVLVDEDDAVLGPLVHRPGRAGGHARRVEAVLADARQVEHEGLLELLGDVGAHVLKNRVVLHRRRRAAEVVVPVGRPGDLQVLAGEQRLRPRDGGVLLGRGVEQHVVLVGPGLVVVVDVGELGVEEDRGELLPASAGAQREPTPLRELPAALPLLLVLVRAGVAEPGPGLHVVEPHVLRTGAVRPRLLAGDRAGVAADALVEVHHHRHLCHDLHDAVSLAARGSVPLVTSTAPPGTGDGPR
jgi:hypothetical protein